MDINDPEILDFSCGSVSMADVSCGHGLCALLAVPLKGGPPSQRVCLTIFLFSELLDTSSLRCLSPRNRWTQRDVTALPPLPARHPKLSEAD